MLPSTPTHAAVDPPRPSADAAAASATAATQFSRSELIPALLTAIEDSLCMSMFANAIFYAERLYECEATYRHLHILAQCHARSGGAATACRLLQSHYPFFELHVTRPVSAGAAPAAGLGGGGGGGNHQSHQHYSGGSSRARTVFSPPSSNLSSYRGRSGFTVSTPPSQAGAGVGAGGSGGGGSESPLGVGVRVAFRRGDGGEALLLHEPVDLPARWDCHYLFGVCCAQTGRYTEGIKVLEELVRVSTRLESAEGDHSLHLHGLFAGEQGDDEDEDQDSSGADKVPEHARGLSREAEQAMAGAKLAWRRREREQLLKSLGSCTAGCPRYYVKRRPEILYWLGVCAQRQHLDTGLEMHRTAFLSNPLLFSAFESYVQGAWRPSREGCLRVYTSPDPYPSSPVTTTAAPVEAPSPTHTPLSPVTAAAPKAAPIGRMPRGPHPQQQEQQPHQTRQAATLLHEEQAREARQQRERHTLRRFLAPYATASYLVHSFCCQEAQKALQPERFPGLISRKRHREAGGEDVGSGEVKAVAEDSPWRLSNEALVRFHYGDMQGSAAAFRRLLRVAPWRLNDPALMYYSTALWQLRAEGDLGVLAQQLTEEMPMSPITLVVVANTYSLAKESKDAIAMLDRAIQMDSSVAYAHALRGYELLSTGMNKEARDAFNRAVNTDHNMYTAYAGLAELSVREERIETARQYFKQAIALNPLPVIMNRYAATHHRRGASREDLLAALNIYGEAIRYNPNNVSARHQRADVLLSLGMVDDAIAEVQELIRSYPEEAMLHVTLARCQEALGLTRQAVKSYHDALTLDTRWEGVVRGCIERLSAAADGGAAGSAGTSPTQ